ncbi:alpha-galactosidase [Saccharothrix variisporea]|uniref:alpha-galactosidase n=1 Tax=Saccharothrix variisporea TaxID=543527 RepID=A0A495XHF3_9PSEU|nr:alpha-galactosidase [Saccharothrix variisporea]RKT72606.1 alpha-galactosidase [Saccharothrix variisporea]
MADVTHLRAAGVSLVLDHRGGTLPRVLHWGADLGPVDLDSLALATAPQPVGYSADGPVEVAVLPEQSAGWLGTPGLVGNRAGRAFSTAFRVVEVDGTTYRAVDEAAGLELRLEVELTDSGLVRQRASVTNTGDSDFAVDALSVTLPVPAEAVEILDFTGRWTRERSPQRTRFTQGLRVRENRTGRTGFDSAYLMAAGTEGFGNRSGEIWAVHTAWSGNHRTFAERTRHAVSLLGSGELLLSGEVVLAPGETYRSPWQFGSYGVGLDAVSARFHEWMRARPNHPRSPRPVVVNTWEAVYFDHDLTRLKALADKAAEVGAERFVLDDGWFGSRRDDSSGLGDWYVSDEVWPDGLGPLIDHVTARGMQFGLWVEPEMVNENSDLARAHPDWIMSPGDRLPRKARHQQVLDLANPEAFKYVLERLDDLLTTYDIAYLKWDHNRDLVEAGHQGKPGVHGQTVALYRLLDELRTRHPSVEIESCSSGGGRVDLEVLQRTDRVWASDCIDALERQSIQRWTNVLVPLELIGSHIGADTSHTTHRRHPVDFRAGTALFGHFGIEWDLMAAGPEELERLTAWVALYKELRGLLHTGTSVHGDHPDPAVSVHGVVAADRTDAVFAVVSTATSEVYPTGAVRLPGLDPDRSYHVRPLPPGDVPDGNPHHWGVKLPWWEKGVELTGRALTSTGVQSPVLYPERLILLRATAI